MQDPGVMTSLKQSVQELTVDFVPAELFDNIEVMALALGTFIQDPDNLDALLPLLEKVEEVEQDLGIVQGNLLNSMGYNSTDDLVAFVEEKYRNFLFEAAFLF